MSERREKRRKIRELQILDAARIVIERNGLDSFTIAQLAEELNAGVGGLYRYFSSKQELVHKLRFQALEELQVLFHKALEEVKSFLVDYDLWSEKESVASLVQILAVLWVYVGESAQEALWYRLLDVSSVSGEELSKQNLAKLAEVLQVFVQLFQEAEDTWGLEPGCAEQRTYAGWGVIHGFNHFFKRDRFQEPHLQTKILLLFAMRTLFHGWGATPRALDEAFALFEAFQQR